MMSENGNGKGRRLGANASCPICARAAVEKFRPFCSKRCADLDLHRWLSGSYVIPGSADSEEDGAEGTEPTPGKPPKDEAN